MSFWYEIFKNLTFRAYFNMVISMGFYKVIGYGI